MKILFLTNNDISLDLCEWLKNNEKQVILYNKKLTLNELINLNPDFLISYNYKYIINKDVLKETKGKAINLHISYLPWNRGAYPNVWSFLENTPKGVTIHLIDEGIDTGDILVQKEILINEEEHTLKSSYILLHEEIQKLFKENWEKIKNREIIQKAQKGQKTIHYKKDFEKIKPLVVQKGWHISIKELKKFYKEEVKQ